MPILDQLIPLYLTACTVEGKTDRTVQSYAETLRQFRRAGRELGLPNSVRAFRPAHVYLFMGWVRERGGVFMYRGILVRDRPSILKKGR